MFKGPFEILSVTVWHLLARSEIWLHSHLYYALQITSIKASVARLHYISISYTHW